MTDVTPPARQPAHDMELHRPRRLPRWWWAPIPLVALALVGWWMTHPQDIPTDTDGATTTTKVDRPVFVGLTSEEAQRSFTIRSVALGEGAEGATVEALVCRGGRITVTASAEPFCEDLVAAEGARVELAEDQLLVSVTAAEAQRVSLDDLEISYREGLQWGSHSLPDVTVEVVS